jgi:hypothetical protein
VGAAVWHSAHISTVKRPPTLLNGSAVDRQKSSDQPSFSTLELVFV